MISFAVVLLLFFIFCSGFLSASETALFSLSSMKVKSYAGGEDTRKKLIAALLSRPRDLLVTIIILNISFNILIQNTTSSIFGDFSGWFYSVGIPLILTLVFGEIIPKSFGLSNNESIAYRVAPILNATNRLLFPFRKVLIAVTGFISRCLFFFLRKEEEISIDELKHALRTSKESGVVTGEEADLVRGYLELEETTVKEQLRPREEVLFFDIEEPLSRLIHLFVDQECTRIPVCRKKLDDVLGIITTKAFFLNQEKLKNSDDLIPLLKKPLFVPETMSARILLQHLYLKQESLALVVDEYGSVSGLISLEDLVETVVGEIEDRRDEKNRYTRAGDDIIIASGKLELTEVEEIFDVSLKHESTMVTVGGWLTEMLGEIPKAGRRYVTKDLLFHVLAADPTRVRRVYIRRLRSKKI